MLEDCDITSSTGSGIAAEGGEHTVLRCSIHGCQRHGVAVFGTLEGDECKVGLPCSCDYETSTRVLVHQHQ